MRVSVLIPTLDGGDRFLRLLDALDRQEAPHDLHVIDSDSSDGTAQAARDHGADVEVIDRADFHHAATRNRLARKARGDAIVFLTQDAVPLHDDFLDRITAPLAAGCAAAHARHVPDDDARPTDAYHRRFNYPPTSHVRTREDIQRLGVRAYFFSNAAAAYDARALRSIGGFPLVFHSEDVAACAALLHAGHRVAYAADARVLHSHRLGLRGQYRRYVDTGTAYAQMGDLLTGARTTGEGLRFLHGQLAHLARHHPLWLPYALAEAGVKFAGFRRGLRSASA